MDRYSFFSFIAVFCDYSFQSVIFNDYCGIGNSVVYADEFSDVDIVDSSVDIVDSSVDSSSEIYIEKSREIINEEIVDEVKENEFYSWEENADRLISSRAFPSHNWSFSYQTDWKNVPDQYSSFLSYFKGLFLANVNNFMDHAATRIIELGYQQDDIIRKINADNNILIGNIAKAKSEAIISAVAQAQAYNDSGNRNLIANIESVRSKLGADNLVLIERMTNQDNAIYKKLSDDNITLISNISKAKSEAISSAVSQSKDYNDSGNRSMLKNIEDTKILLQKQADEGNRNLLKNIDDTKILLQKQADEGNRNLLKNIDDTKILLQKQNDEGNRNLLSKIQDVVNVNSSQQVQIDAIALSLSTLNFNSDGIIKAINDTSKVTNANILLNTHAVDVVRDSVNTLNDSYKDSIYGDISSVEGGINRNDGALTKMVKGQFSRLIKENEKIFFTDGKVSENEKDGTFITLLKNLFYSLRYSIIEEFSDFAEIFKHEMLLNRNNVSEYILLVNKNLETANGWLDLIYNKKINVIIPPISIPPSELFVLDYDRLQKMFDGISFGSITNEAGKNIWDFLSELVKALADVVEALADLVSKIMQMLIDVFVPTDVSFITDELSKLSSLFTKKFSFAIELKDFFTSIFDVDQVAFKTQLEFGANGDSNSYDISFLMPFISAFRAPLSALIVISNLFYCYKRVIGQGDVIA